jgi:hypothetical protein
MCWAVWCNIIIIIILVAHIFINIIVIIIIILIIILIADFVWLSSNSSQLFLWYCISITPHHTPLTNGSEFRSGKHSAPMRIESHYEIPPWNNFYCCCHCKSTCVLNGDWHMRRLLRVFRFRGALCYRKIKCVINKDAGCGILLTEHVSTM